MLKTILQSRGLRMVATAIATVYLMVSIAAGIILMEGAFHVARRPLTQEVELATMVAPWSKNGVTDATITASDGAVLKGWYIYPTRPNGSSVILLHGVADNREGVTQYATIFLGAGYAVLLPDSRAHGESGGALVTYGLLESDDVQRWSQWLSAQINLKGNRDKARCTYLFGESMGAAIALEATTKVRDLCAVVAEASFSNFREIGYERIAQSLGSPIGVTRAIAWPTVESAFLYARVRYGLDLQDASLEQSLAA
jgi:fermentation-respiration switch protein FrsA (DUF1100 family)